MKKWYLILLAALSVGFLACSDKNAATDTSNSSSDTSSDTGIEDDNVNDVAWSDTIYIAWSGNSATVTGTADNVEVSNSNGYVTVNSSTTNGVVYALSGSGSGQLTIYGSFKHNVTLNDLTLTCSNGPAINNQCHKKCYIVVNGTNSLTDGSTYASSDEDRKAALFSEGQIIFSGSGTLTVKGNYKHAIASDDYIHITSDAGVFDLTATSDGLHANDAIHIKSGTLTIKAGSDGIQCDSLINISGGTMTISAGADGIQSDTATITISGGSITVTDAVDKGITAYGNIHISGGTIRISSEYKCIKTKANLTITDGDIQVICNGTASSSGGGGGRPGGWGGGSSSSENSSPEGIEAKGTISISGGKIYAQSADDAINAGGDMTISGGYVMAYSTGNDGLDANGDLYIKGGVVWAICTGSNNAEVAIDANTEGRKQLYIQGGSIVTCGGLENGFSSTLTCRQAASWNKSTWYALYDGDELVMAYKTPASGGTPMVVATKGTASLKSGVTVSGGTSILNGYGNIGGTISGGSSVTLSTYSGNSGGGGRRP